jgi:hypothetical protein
VSAHKQFSNNVVRAVFLEGSMTKVLVLPDCGGVRSGLGFGLEVGGYAVDDFV